MYPKTATWEPDTMRDRQMLTRAKGDEIRPEILYRNEIGQRGSGARGASGGACGGACGGVCVQQAVAAVRVSIERD